MTDDSELKTRLSQLEARVPVAAAPVLEKRRPRIPILGRSLVATALVLVAATMAIGAAVVGREVDPVPQATVPASSPMTPRTVATRTDVRGWPGVENSGQPLEGAKLECMTPPRAQAYLKEHGFTNVVWQIERDGSPSVQASNPPDRGYVVPGAIVDGVLMMIVDERASAHAVGSCYGDPMP